MSKKIEFLDLGQQPLANYYLNKSQIKNNVNFQIILAFKFNKKYLKFLIKHLVL